jgi:hypothetical protein
MKAYTLWAQMAVIAVLCLSGTAVSGEESSGDDDNHDQINDSGTLSLFDPVTLSILPSNNFVPSVGDEFVIMTWQTELQGTFSNVLVDPVFNSNNIAFDLISNNIGSAGSLTLRATVVPEPSTVLLLGIGILCIAGYRRGSLV